MITSRNLRKILCPNIMYIIQCCLMLRNPRNATEVLLIACYHKTGNNKRLYEKLNIISTKYRKKKIDPL